MVKIWRVNIRLCNVLTLYLCTLFLVPVHLPPCTRNNVHKYRVSTLHPKTDIGVKK